MRYKAEEDDAMVSNNDKLTLSLAKSKSYLAFQNQNDNNQT